MKENPLKYFKLQTLTRQLRDKILMKIKNITKQAQRADSVESHNESNTIYKQKSTNDKIYPIKMPLPFLPLFKLTSNVIQYISLPCLVS